MIAITIYSRPDYHLYEEMKAVIQTVVKHKNASITIDKINISTDPALELRYGLEIPVLIMNRKKTTKYHVTEDEVARMIRARTNKIK